MTSSFPFPRTDDQGASSRPLDERVPPLLLNLIANSDDAILALDPEGRILYWNDGARKLFGYEDKEVVGRHFSFLVPDDVLEGGEIERLKRLTEKRGSLHNYETKRRTKDGKYIDVSVTRTLLHGPDHELVGSSAIVRDISERKKLEQELVEANTMARVGQLSARVAHEIKNPLAGISGAMQVLRDLFEETDSRRTVIHEVLKEIRRLDNTVNDLLDFSRPRKPQLQRVNLVSQVDRVLGVLKEEPTVKDVNIVKRFVREEVVVRGDPELIKDIFFNLTMNAAQAMEGREDSRLLITIASRPGGAMVSFTDNGPGIPDDIRAQIFEPFFTTKIRGTGLGLAITRKNVEAHCGEIHLRTQRKGGTSFTIYFPEHGGDEPGIRNPLSS